MKKWTKNEIEFLRDNWETMSDGEIGKELDRNYGDVQRKRYKLNLKHPAPQKKSELYHLTKNNYTGMIHRCYYKKNPSYKHYGGKSVRVCDRWRGLDGFDHFVEDMGLRPSKQMTLGRINNDVDYSPENCRWESRKQQANNRTNNIVIYAWDEWKTITEWLDDKRCSLNRNQIERNIKHGLSGENILTTEKIDTIKKKGKGYRRRFVYKSGVNKKELVWKTAFGETQLLGNWLEDPRCEVLYPTIVIHMNNGDTFEEAMKKKVVNNRKRHNVSYGKTGRFIEYQGEIKNLAGWSKDPRCKCSYWVLQDRTGRLGWDFEKALTTPIDEKYRSKKAG